MLNKFFKGLAKTRDNLFGRIGGLLGKPLSEDMLESLEESLILADVGHATAGKLVESIRKTRDRLPADVLRQEIYERVNIPVSDFACNLSNPCVVLFLGVNGSGKTTTIGKLSAKLSAKGKRVMLAAADTFRAAAADQLSLWAQRTGAMIVKSEEGADPAAVAFDAVKAAIARGADYVLIDTAGRLQTRTNLMEELKKIKRVVGKALPGAPHETWLVLDASIGQNSLSQVELFNQAVGLTGLILAKLDGTSKGGVLVAISEKFRLPVRYVGLGEGIDDIEEFDADQFARALVGQ